MKSIAVIGTGIMGHGIADNFLKNGYHVTVWNRTREKTDDLVKKGAIFASSVTEAVKNADIVFEVTANDESSRTVWTGDDGILENATPDQSLITCATLSVGWINELAGKTRQRDLTFFDMPMTGARIGAETGRLTLLVGGSKTKLTDISNDLGAISTTIRHFGECGSGTKFKLILNSLQAIHVAGFAEAIKMADEAKLDVSLVGAALAERPGGVVTEFAWSGYQKQPDPINFSVEWIRKDLGYAAEMSDSKHPLLDDVIAIYDKTVTQGLGQADWTSITKQ